MRVLADTHVHLYDGHDLDLAFSAAFANLPRLLPGGGGVSAEPVELALLLSERHDCHAFERLRSGERASLPARHRVERLADEWAVVVTNGSGARLHLVAGRQIATRERLEVLALCGDPGVPDGGDILDTIGRVAEAGSVPVLAWAPGKWTGRRAVVIASTLDAVRPQDVLIGDTSMRPRGWRTGPLMREAQGRGFTVVAGTDPLPFAGQELVIGRYGIVAEAEFDPAAPVAGFRALFTSGRGRVAIAGRRDSLASVVSRLVRHRLAKQPDAHVSRDR
jgi:hypothetical protein